MTVTVILGGHGRVGLLIAKELSKKEDNEVVSIFRNPDQTAEVAATGAIPKIMNIESATVADFVEVFKGADFIVWTAGAGGKGAPSRTYAIDRDAAIRSMQAARQVIGIKRYVMISYLGSANAPQLDPTHPLYHYGQAKHAADKYLIEFSGLNYTIVNPGHLSDDAASKKLEFHAKPFNAKDRTASRENVALLVTDLITDEKALNHTLGKEVEILDGDTPILEGLRSL
ncbi:hypothetical protein DASB73_019590 [Starmerella bacillaris]|uniref:NAD(P)-binding domain-containing protein n=1 Tax=Starmerella bacillaris TaxID=1247836 RepID=A0AAV5RHE0_STABA|nr:hypothetical protein DASB73_019590 [Starmerella bacillaris]